MFDDATLLIENNGFGKKSQMNQTKGLEKECRTDQTIPNGWSMRGEGKGAVLRSPTGLTYRSRRNAFEEMLISGKYSDEEIEAMKGCLIHEGWEDREDIPSRWKIKKKGYGIFLMEQGGRIFSSTTKAIEFLRKYNKYYSVEDLEKLSRLTNCHKNANRKYPQEIPQQEQVQLITYPNDLSPSIQLQDAQNNMQINLSMNQVILDETDEVTDYLEENNEKTKLEDSLNKSTETQQTYEPKMLKQNRSRDKDRFRSKLSWQLDEELYPQGWKYSVAQNGDKECLRLLSPCGKSLPSVRVALGFMVTNNYPEQEIDMMRNVMLRNNWYYDSGLPKKWFYRRSGLKIQLCDNKGRFFVSREKAFEFFQNDLEFSKKDYTMLEKFQPPCTLNIDNDDSWNSNEEIYPPGWKCKVIHLPKVSSGEKKYEKSISPSRKLFVGRRAAMSHMIVNQYPAEDIQKITRAVERDGWYTSHYLPLAWTYRSKWSKIEFSNEDGICLGSQQLALKSLNKNPVKNHNQILMLEKFFKAKSDGRLTEIMKD